MRSAPALVTALVLAFPLLTGCLAQDDDAGTPGSAPGVAAPELPLASFPKVDAVATLADLREFSEAFPYRQSGEATHIMSRAWLDERLSAAGLTVLRHSFPASFRGLPAKQYDGENIIGIKWGADREHWVVVGAHYDITEGAVYGTYDDGSGTIMTVKLAEAFADVPTDRTIAFILFDQEERGLVGSRAFVEDVLDGSFGLPVTVDAMIDLDMVGITWPHPADLIAWENSVTLKAYAEEARKAAGIPDESVQYRDPNGGVSDGASFIQAGIATIYWWSDWDEVVTKDGQAIPAAYPFWHRADTYETMVLMAGDEATLTAGFQTTLDVVSPVLLAAASAAFVPDGVPPEA